MSKHIIVLGMHRGGTSLVANLLHRWGAYAGQSQQLLAADQNNIQGYWEYVPLIQFNQQLLNSVGASWFIPPGRDEEKALENLATDPGSKRRAEQLLAEMRKGGQDWFWKDPRLTILLSFWKQMWGEPIYVVTVRHPLEIAISLRKRDRLPISASLLIWQQYMVQALRQTEGSKHRIFISYEKLLNTPVEQCHRLASFIDSACEYERDREPLVGNMVGAINTDLRHNISRLPFSDVPQATQEQKALYIFLNEMAEDRVEPFEQLSVELYPGWKEYLQTFDALSKLWQQFQGREQLLLSLITKAHREVFGL
jgi:hypothetical protein